MAHRLGLFVGRISDGRRDRIAASLAAMLVFGAFVYGVNAWLGRLSIAASTRSLTNAILVGGGAATFVWLLLIGNCDRRRLAREQVERIAEFNHHIRNALEVLAMSHYHDPDREHYVMVMDSVNRIEATLKELSDTVGSPARKP